MPATRKVLKMEPLETTAGGKAVVMNYTPLTDGQKAAVVDAKTAMAIAYNVIEAFEATFGKKRDFSAAKTKLQESSMWLVRGITNAD